MDLLDIRLFGTMQLLRGELPLTKFESNKVRALIAYLVVESERPHQRRKLASFLWPEIPETNALSNLRYALSNLRKVIGDRTAQPPCLLITPQTLQFNRQCKYRVDVNLFEQYRNMAGGNPLDLESLLRAADLYRGRFLEGFSIPDSIPYEEWIVVKRERLDRMAYQVFHQLANDFEIMGDYERAIAFDERQIALEPWREEVHCQLMRCLYFSGQRSAAIVKYETCRQALMENLAIEPSLETRQLYEQIRDETLPLPQPLPSFFLPPDSFSVKLPAFVSREEPLSCLHKALHQVIGGKGQLMLVSGSSGQGKTALINEFIHQALKAHPSIAAAFGNSYAYFGSGDPFMPFREILEMLSGQVEHRWEAGSITHDLARRLWRLAAPCAQALVECGPALLGTFVPGHALLQRVSHIVPRQVSWLIKLREIVGQEYAGTPTAMNDLFQQYSCVLDKLSQNVPLILFVDDLQWADQASLELFFYLSRQLSDRPILLLGAFRPEEECRSEYVAALSLADLITELRLHNGDILIDLDEITDRKFIDAYLDLEPNQLDKTFREKLFQYTCSHPLYTVEMLYDMKQRGDLKKNATDEWTASESLDWNSLPPRIEAAIEERLCHLPQYLLDLLKTASIEGERFTAEVVASVLGEGEKHILEQLRQELDQHYRLVKADSSMRFDDHRVSRYRFCHILFQKYLYSQLDVLQRAELHEKIGYALEAHYQEIVGEISAPLAIHFELAGLPTKAIKYLEMAGQRSIRFSSFDIAIARFKKALLLLEDQPESEEKYQQEFSLLMGLSVPLMFKSGFASTELRTISNRMMALLEILPLNVEMFPVLHTLTQYYGLRADYEKTGEVLQLAEKLARMSGDEFYLCLSQWGLGFLMLWLGKFEESLMRLDAMVNFYDPQKHHTLRFTYGNDAGVASRVWSSWPLWLLGYPEKAIVRCQEAIDLANWLDDAPNQLLAQIMTALLLLLMKRTQNVDQLFQSCCSLLEINKGAIYAVDLQFLQGFYDFQMGGKETGLAKMCQSMDAYQELGNRSMLSLYYTLIAEGYFELGEISQSDKMLQKAENFIEETQECFYKAEVLRLQARLLEEAENFQAAENLLFQALHIAREQKAKSLELRAAMSLAELWEKQNRTEEAYQVLAEVTNWFTEGFDMADLKEARALLERLG